MLYPESWSREENKTTFDLRNTLLTNPSSGRILLYPENWSREENKTTFDLLNAYLVDSSNGNVTYRSDRSFRVHPMNNITIMTTSITNIFDTLLPLVNYWEGIGSLSERQFTNISIPYVLFYSPMENSSDHFVENVKIMSKVLPSNLTLNHLLYHVSKYVDRDNCDTRFLKNLWGDLKTSNSTLDNSKLLAMAFVDLYKACLPTFRLLENSSMNMSENTGYKIVYNFSLNSKTENIEYKIMQVYIVKHDMLYILSYNASKVSYLRYLPLVEKMINSLRLS